MGWGIRIRERARAESRIDAERYPERSLRADCSERGRLV
jgi:hypothetical protein